MIQFRKKKKIYDKCDINLITSTSYSLFPFFDLYIFTGIQAIGKHTDTKHWDVGTPPVKRPVEWIFVNRHQRYIFLS